jgi:hypothetical protein
MQATARRLSVVSAKSSARRRLIRNVRRLGAHIDENNNSIKTFDYGLSGDRNIMSLMKPIIMDVSDQMHARRMSHYSTVSLRALLARVGLLLAFACLSGCGMPVTDAATRLAFDINAGARKLRASTDSRLEIQHKPVSIPDGVKGRYEVGLQSSLERSLDHPTKGGTLFVRDLTSRDAWTTTCHLNYVRVPRELNITKNAGESVNIVLERVGDGKIDVTGVR